MIVGFVREEIWRIIYVMDAGGRGDIIDNDINHDIHVSFVHGRYQAFEIASSAESIVQRRDAECFPQWLSISRESASM
jgi:hypothetical protein